MIELATYLIFRFLIGLFGLLPEPVVRRSGEAFGWAASYLAGDRYELAKRTMRRVTRDSKGTPRRARKMFASYGRYWAEVFWFRARRKEELLARAEVLNAAAVKREQDQGRGIIFALPHLGNWEAAGAVAENIGAPVLAVAENLGNRRITEWFIEARGGYGIDIVLAGRPSVYARLVRHLSSGGAVALVADRDLSGKGVEVEFFGETTTLPPGPVALADKTGAALFPVGAYFKDGAGYRMVIEDPLPLPHAEEREVRIRLGTQAFAARMEELIRGAPEQWHLFQPNWPSDREWLEGRR